MLKSDLSTRMVAFARLFAIEKQLSLRFANLIARAQQRGFLEPEPGNVTIALSGEYSLRNVGRFTHSLRGFVGIRLAPSNK